MCASQVLEQTAPSAPSEDPCVWNNLLQSRFEELNGERLRLLQGGDTSEDLCWALALSDFAERVEREGAKA